jgi:Flp pilus assembly pilin Flp
MKTLMIRLVREEHGQDLIEYALIATFVSLVAAAGATALGTSLNGWYNAVSGSVDNMKNKVP